MALTFQGPLVSTPSPAPHSVARKEGLRHHPLVTHGETEAQKERSPGLPGRKGTLWDHEEGRQGHGQTAASERGSMLGLYTLNLSLAR